MPETNETYHPMTFDAIKIGLASPEKIRSWTHRTLNLPTSPVSSGKNGGSRALCATVCLSLQALLQRVERVVGARRCKEAGDHQL